MKHNVTVILAACTLVCALLACNLPASQQSSQPDYPATGTAQAAMTLQAQGQTTATPSTAPASSPAPTATSTPSAVTADVMASTSCRTGPGTVYAIVTNLNAGQTAVVVGQDPLDQYWLVDNPNGSGTCWLWGLYATVTGNSAAVPSVTAPAPPDLKAAKATKAAATPTQGAKAAAPAAPANFSSTGLIACTLTKNALGGYNLAYKGRLTWDQNANTSGFRIYQGLTLLQTVSSGTATSAAVAGTVAASATAQGVSFGIEAFNAAGSSTREDITVSCP